MTYPEAAELVAERAIALLPVGATEAHGPHLPLDTDVVISETAACRAVMRMRTENIRAAVLPPINYAVADFASEFAGTITLPLATATALIRDTIIGACRTGFAGVVVVNAHFDPGNMQAIRDAVSQATEAGFAVRFPDVTRKPHALRLGDEFKSGACHAGSYETSLVLAADPFMVNTEIAGDLAPNPSSLSVAIREGKKSFVEAGGDAAYFGYPADATASEGEHLYGELTDILVEAARALLAAL